MKRQTGVLVAAWLWTVGSALAESPPAASGMASWYDYRGRHGANGAMFGDGFTAAHPTLAFGTLVEVTNLRNGRRALVRIADRGPFVRGRIIDLSRQAAASLDMLLDGVAPVRIEVIATTQ